MATRYDEVTYPGRPYPQTHPARLAAIQHLLGTKVAPPERCRVLELGCGDGSNLLAMATALPDSSFVGVDLAERAIAAGRELAAESQLTNVQLLHGELGSLDESLGLFDYVIAHGVYSWVPEQTRDDLLAACKRHLAASGVAFVSYSTYPGAHFRELVRDMMLFHAGGLTQPEQKVARGIELVRLIQQAHGSTPYGAVLEQELRRLSDGDPGYVFHDDFAEHNQPVYFSAFAEHAASHGLAFAAEASFGFFEDPRFSRDTIGPLRACASGDPLAEQQYLDFLRGTPFRQTLLCHGTSAAPSSYEAERLLSLFALGDLRPEREEPALASRVEERFLARDSLHVASDEPLTKALFFALGRAWPSALPVSELLAQAELLAGLPVAVGPALAARVKELGVALLRAAAARLIAISASPPRFVSVATERPCASGLARAQAKRGPLVINLRHALIRLEDERLRRLVVLADGTRTRAELARALSEQAAPARSTPPLELEELERVLNEVARRALLIA